MDISPQNADGVIVRLAQNASEIEAAQRLRYKVFYEEMTAKPDAVMAMEKRDFDTFDDHADHVIVIDQSEGKEKIIGTYRLMRREMADKCGGFYTSGEFDIAPLLQSGSSLLELGRSCVLPEYRTRAVMQVLWEGIADYVLNHNTGIMFGCASLYGTDLDTLRDQMAYLYHYHLAPENLRPKALESRYIDLNRRAKDDLNAKAIFNTLPPLVKGYLRVGAVIGDGAVIDSQFDTTDVCILVETKNITARYHKHYLERDDDASARQSVGA
jgi:putative hemolysin